MKEPVLKSLMELFAYVSHSSSDRGGSITRFFVSEYLKFQVGDKLHNRYMAIYDSYYNEVRPETELYSKKQTALFSVNICQICESFNKELELKEKILIVLKLIELGKYVEAVRMEFPALDQTVSKTIDLIADTMNIPDKELDYCKYFILDLPKEGADICPFLVVGKTNKHYNNNMKFLFYDGLSVEIIFLYLKTIDIFVFKFTGEGSGLTLNGQPIYAGQVYVFTHGAVIKTSRGEPVYYSEVAGLYFIHPKDSKVELTIDEVEYSFRHSDNGIKKFSISAGSGQLIGIMGGSGTGKSTLLHLVTGKLHPDHGRILINGYDLSIYKEDLTHYIGFVPQDDLLFENLTVFQNLYYNASLCLKNYDKVSLLKLVHETLTELGLDTVKDLKVGSPLNKYISGGQRKRLNIALELIRKPDILLIDEPTSGLSSKDSGNIMDILKGLALGGLLVMVNIHQPSSSIFKLFNNILILDRGGYPIFYGEPIDSLEYFKKALYQVDAEESECTLCGNINPEQLFDFIEAKTINEFGEFSETRKNSPEDWYTIFRRDNPSFDEIKQTVFITGENRLPGKLKQFKTFFIRNLLSKLADRQFVVLSIIIPPLLAVLLGCFTKYMDISGSKPYVYQFSKNDNIPSFLFMGVVVALFVGMIISAEELYTDRRIREREGFLQLSLTGYINAKISLLFILSAIQSSLFVLLSNSILGIKGMFFTYWIVLFSIFCFANLFGLVVSKSFKSIVSIYIMIPLLLIPQLLLGGVMIKYDKINYRFSSPKYVPVIADMMASRWAFEALAVTQFRDNEYEKHFFDIDRSISNLHYENLIVIPRLLQCLDKYEASVRNPSYEEMSDEISFISHTLPYVQAVDFSIFADSLQKRVASINTLQDIKTELVTGRRINDRRLREYEKQRDKIIVQLQSGNSENRSIVDFKNKYHNQALEDLVLNRKEIEKSRVINNELIRNFEPVFAFPSSAYGRAHYYAAAKRLSHFDIDTLIFNTIVLWLMTVALYFLLTGDKLFLTSAKNSGK